MPTNPEDTKKLEIPESLRKMIIPDATAAEKQIVVETPKGYCSTHGQVGWARMVLYDHDPTTLSVPHIVSEHCVYCLSRVFTALIGKLKYDEEPEE